MKPTAHRPVVWMIDDEVDTLKPYIRKIRNGEEIQVETRQDADQAMEFFDALTEGEKCWECDLLVIDMKMSLPRRPEYLARLPSVRHHDSRMGSYLIEYVRRCGLMMPCFVVSIYEPEANMPAVWESYARVQSAASPPRNVGPMPTVVSECLKVLADEFHVHLRKKEGDTLIAVTSEIRDRAWQSFRGTGGHLRPK